MALTKSKNKIIEVRLYFILILLSWLLALTIFLFRNWVGGFLVALALMLCLLPFSLWNGEKNRFLVLFSLIAMGDFLKRFVFLFPDQEGFSQYVVYVLPYLYFAVVFLLPEVLRSLKQPVEINSYLTIFLGWMLLNTWVASQTTLLAKMAATIFLLMPWLMIYIAAKNPSSFLIVSKTIIFFGSLNVLYGAIQFVSGPTIIERLWSEAVVEFSIGAQHVQAFLFNWFGGVNFYRPNGLQADAYTFGLFSLNALVFTWLLRAQNRLRMAYFLPISFVFLAGVLISTVRSIWISTIMFILYAFLGSRIRLFSRSWFVFLSFILIFYSANFIANFLYSFMGLAGMTQNPFLARALTFGTLSDRVGAVSAFWQDLPNLWLLGKGLAASDWITSKFGGFSDLPLNYGRHNFIVQYLWWGGVIGLLLMMVLLAKAFQKAEFEYLKGRLPLSVLGIFAAYLVSMVLLGQGNGSSFLNFVFFYAIGLMYSPSFTRKE